MGDVCKKNVTPPTFFKIAPFAATGSPEQPGYTSAISSPFRQRIGAAVVPDAHIVASVDIVHGGHVIRNPEGVGFEGITWAKFIVDNRFQNAGRVRIGGSPSTWPTAWVRTQHGA